MPLKKNIKRVMVIGSGPIVIGQAAEFDYAGTQACRALKEEGLEVILVNSNPATIMTDNAMADKIYIEPLTLETVKRIIKKERPDSLLSTLGGQTGLTLSMQLAKEGFLDKYNVQLLGANPETIDKAEDRQLFKDTMIEIGQPVIPSLVVTDVESAVKFADEIGYPVIIRPAFTLGGTGGGIVDNEEELREITSNGLELSPITQVLVEKCISGWKETGFTRAKNAGNIIMKNLMDFCIGTPLFWLFGFGIMFGDGKFIGAYKGIADSTYASAAPDGVPFFAFLIFQTVFCATAATIVSGAMAERTKFISYCIYSAIISLLVYPIEAHWIWGGGWLADLGFHDFAGSTCVHMAGGVAAFVGAAILGPRIGKYDKNGKAKAIPGHSLTLGALGCFILWFCWFGFNGASTTSMEGDAIPLAGKVFVTTNLAAAVATITTMIFTWIKYKKPDVSMTLNASLAGLVAITAPCDTVSPVSAAIIGIVAGILVVVGVEFIDQVLKIDDPVGACGVHMLNGMWGTIAVGLFSDGTCGEKGLFTGGGAHLLGIQLLGMVSVIAWVAITMTIVFQIIKHTIGLRASEQEEILGLDVTEHGLVSSYADFAPAMSQAMLSYTKDDAKSVVKVDKSTEPVVPVEKAIKVESYATDAPSADGTPKMTKVAIICKQQKLNDLITALEDIDVTGVTVTNVLGCGMQKGQPEYYRGAVVETNLLPKVKVEVVICKVPTRAVIDAAKAALYTGHIGDGKIFIYNIENVVKIRTNEEGYDALQDD